MTPQRSIGSGTIAAGAAAAASSSRRPDRPSSIVAPQRTGDVGQQPQRRPAGPSRSVCVRAHWNRRRLARARGGSESGKRCQIPLIFPIRSGRSAERARESAPLSVLQIFRSVVDDPAALDRLRHHRRRRSGRSIVISSPRSPELHRRPAKNWRRRPAAAAPPSRPEQVGLRQSSLESAPPRARAWGQRKW